MIPSSHRNPRNKAIAEALAMLADTNSQSLAAHERDDLLWEDAAEFCAALDRLARESFVARSVRRISARR